MSIPAKWKEWKMQGWVLFVTTWTNIYILRDNPIIRACFVHGWCRIKTFWLTLLYTSPKISIPPQKHQQQRARVDYTSKPQTFVIFCIAKTFFPSFHYAVIVLLILCAFKCYVKYRSLEAHFLWRCNWQRSVKNSTPLSAPKYLPSGVNTRALIWAVVSQSTYIAVIWV